MPQVDPRTVKARAARLCRAATERRMRWLDGLIGSTRSVLNEGSSGGHTDNFAPVAIAGGLGRSGPARITGREGDRLKAVWA
jgi:tRNA A37 methylthiotransferase MiaB